VILDGCAQLSDFHDVIANCERNRMCAIDRTELADGGLDVLVNGSLGDIENFADLPGGFSARNPCQHLPFARGQQFPFRGGATGQCNEPFAWMASHERGFQQNRAATFGDTRAIHGTSLPSIL
jgi:hypothetical protein